MSLTSFDHVTAEMELRSSGALLNYDFPALFITAESSDRSFLLPLPPSAEFKASGLQQVVKPSA